MRISIKDAWSSGEEHSRARMGIDMAKTASVTASITATLQAVGNKLIDRHQARARLGLGRAKGYYR